MPVTDSDLMSWSWGTVSKAFFTSKKTAGCSTRGCARSWSGRAGLPGWMSGAEIRTGSLIRVCLSR